MLTYKEFYVWLEGYLYGKLENKNIDIVPIIEKMSQVKEDSSDISIRKFDHIPIPINPIKISDNPKPPSWDITFENDLPF